MSMTRIEALATVASLYDNVIAECWMSEQIRALEAEREQVWAGLAVTKDERRELSWRSKGHERVR
jgi:hypothetical protein